MAGRQDDAVIALRNEGLRVGGIDDLRLDDLVGEPPVGDREDDVITLLFMLRKGAP